MVVGEERAEIELERGLRFVELDGLGPGFEERIDPRRIEVVAGLVLQIGAGLLGAVFEAIAASRCVAWDPAPATGPGGGAAEHRLLLGDDDREAPVG